MTAETLASIAWPDEKDLEYCYPIKGGPRHTRHLKLGWVRPGPTGVLKNWGGSEGLIRWAANLERAACLEAMVDEWRTQNLDKLPSAESLVAAIEARLGPARSHQKALEKAADIGTAAHARVEWELRSLMGLDPGVKPVLTEESTVAFMAWRNAWASAGITPLRIEQPVWSDRHEYAGTADLICLRDGKLGLIDLKTSKAVWDTHHLQAASYCKAIEEMTGHPVEWCELWKIPKSLDSHFEAIPLGQLYNRNLDTDELFQTFINILSAWKTLSGLTEPEKRTEA